MTKTGLYILDLSLSCPERHNSYYSIVGKFLGYKVQILTLILFLWLLYFSLSSYISGCVSIILSYLQTDAPYVSYFNISLIYVLLFGSIIVISAKFIMRINGLIVFLKVGLLVVIILSSYSTATFITPINIHLNHTGLLSLFLIVINAFGFQFIVPSLVSYYGSKNHTMFRKMLIFSTLLVLLLYASWLYTIYSIIPLEGEYGLNTIHQSKNQLLAFNNSLLYFLHSKVLVHLLSLFEGIALFGSFFCISLGVFDFLVDVFKSKNRLLMGALTFGPPFILSLFSENMYIKAMSFAGYMAIILEIIIPICAKRKQLLLH